MDFYFVRHGESANNTLFAEVYPNDRQGFERVRSPNPDLTEQGRAQAVLVGKFLGKVFCTGEASFHSRQVSPPVVVSAGENADGKEDENEGDSSPIGVATSNIHEIWSSYLSRAIETGIAIQQGIRDAAGGAHQHPLPPIRLNEKLTEVGGHYQYSTEAEGMVATPGYSNADVVKRWGQVATFSKMPSRNDEGWNRNAQRETPGEGRDRALGVIRLMESAAVGACLQSKQDKSLPGRAVAVITHGDFFKMLLTRLSQIGSESEVGDARHVLDKGTVSVEGASGLGGIDMFPTIPHCTRTACPRLKAAGSTKVRNTSINHLRIDFDEGTRELRWSSNFLDRVDHLEGTSVAVLEHPPSLI